MRGEELLDQLELMDPAYVEAADEKPVRRKNAWVRWGAAAACLGVVLLAGVFLLRGRGPATISVDIGGIAREYRDNMYGGGGPEVSIEWHWEDKPTVDRYTSLERDGKGFHSKRSTLDPSLLGQRLGSLEVTGGDAYSDEVHSLTCEVYEITGVSPELFLAVELDGKFYVFAQHDYDPPATLGELLDSCSLSQTLTLVQFTQEDGPGESGENRRQDDDAYLWSVLEGCRGAEFVEEPERWMESIGEYLSFTAESEALGVDNQAFYVTRSGYIWTNTFSYAYMFRIGEEAAGKIIDYALSHSEPCPRKPLYSAVMGTLTGMEDGYLLIDDSVRCADPRDGMVFRVPLDDVRISRQIDSGYIGVGDLVCVVFTGEIDVGTGNVVQGEAYDLVEAWIDEEGEVLIPE